MTRNSPLLLLISLGMMFGAVTSISGAETSGSTTLDEQIRAIKDQHPPKSQDGVDAGLSKFEQLMKWQTSEKEKVAVRRWMYYYLVRGTAINPPVYKPKLRDFLGETVTMISGIPAASLGEEEADLLFSAIQTEIRSKNPSRDRVEIALRVMHSRWEPDKPGLLNIKTSVAQGLYLNCFIGSEKAVDYLIDAHNFACGGWGDPEFWKKLFEEDTKLANQLSFHRVDYSNTLSSILSRIEDPNLKSVLIEKVAREFQGVSNHWPLWKLIQENRGVNPESPFVRGFMP